MRRTSTATLPARGSCLKRSAFKMGRGHDSNLSALVELLDDETLAEPADGAPRCRWTNFPCGNSGSQQTATAGMPE
jgi:hypothetical protein